MGFTVWWGRFGQTSWNAVIMNALGFPLPFPFPTRPFSSAKNVLHWHICKAEVGCVHWFSFTKIHTYSGSSSSFICFWPWHGGSSSEVLESWVLMSWLQLRLLSGMTTCGNCNFPIQLDARHVAEYCGLTSYHHQKWTVASKLAGLMSCFENISSHTAIVTAAVLVCLALGNC